MKVLVTGASGFVGRYMVAELIQHGHQVVALIHDDSRSLSEVMHAFSDEVQIDTCDLVNRDQVFQRLKKWCPEAIVHLAGIAHVVEAARDVSRLIEVNSLTVKHLCDAINTFSRQSVPVLFASSALVYGNPTKTGVVAADENSPLAPATAYAKSKLAAEFILKCYNGTLVRPRIARPFNHTGPGQSPQFVCPGFVKKVEDTQDGRIMVGNLSALRDISDVRDIVRGYRLMIEYQGPEECFVLGSGRLTRISDILSEIVRISGKSVEPITDTQLLRSADSAAVFANISLAQRLLGWEPEYSLSTTLSDLYEAHVRS